MEQPAQVFGKWLRTRRKKSSSVMRVFAGQIGLAPAEYTEVELGIVHWLNDEHVRIAQEILDLSEVERKEFQRLLEEAREAHPITLEDVYTREQLAPVRTRRDEGRLSDEDREAILDAVFKPLS